MLLSQETGRLAARILHRALGLRLIASSELDGSGVRTEIAAHEALLLEGLSLALVRSDPDQLRWLERRRRHGLGRILPAPRPLTACA